MNTIEIGAGVTLGPGVFIGNIPGNIFDWIEEDGFTLIVAENDDQIVTG